MTFPFTIPKLFDPHIHLRIGPVMRASIPLVNRLCQAYVVMPNAKLPGGMGVRDSSDASWYRNVIIEAANELECPKFFPFMTVMLTDNTDPDDVSNWAKAGVIAGKYYPGELYPHGGVHDLNNLKDVLNEMRRYQIPLSGHFERANFHPLVAERVAIEDFRYLADTGLKVVFEHASTTDAISAVECYPHCAATITPQHLCLTADDVYYQDRMEIANPHNWCRPPAKNENDRDGLTEIATSDDSRFFMATDYAPHLEADKADSPPPAGCACYPAALPVVTTVFANHDRLDRLADFTSGRAAQFYGITLSQNRRLTIVKEPYTVPTSIPVGTGGERIIPWLASKTLSFTVIS